MKRGTLILVIGPSGSGKNTLINAAREAHPSLAFSISATTRSPRAGEVDGDNYHFLTREAFMERAANGEFLEWAEYGGNCYGTLRSEIEPKLAEGQVILADIEVQGARQLRERLSPSELVLIYVDAGTWPELLARIQARATMTEAQIQSRHARYEQEAAFKTEADFVIQNRDGEIEKAKSDFITLVGTHLA